MAVSRLPFCGPPLLRCRRAAPAGGRCRPRRAPCAAPAPRHGQQSPAQRPPNRRSCGCRGRGSGRGSRTSRALGRAGTQCPSTRPGRDPRRCGWAAVSARAAPWRGRGGAGRRVMQDAVDGGLGGQIDAFIGEARGDLARWQAGVFRAIAHGEHLLTLGVAERIGARGALGLLSLALPAALGCPVVSLLTGATPGLDLLRVQALACGSIRPARRRSARRSQPRRRACPPRSSPRGLWHHRAAADPGLGHLGASGSALPR